jgi:nucleoside 2-deoxyribosyltransferase
MKFGDRHLDSAYKGVIEPVGKSSGFEVIRIDEIEDSGNISAQVLENIARSQIIIAELTSERPNCYYECGYAHALGREIIFVIRKGENIHFDLSNYRFIQWETEHELRRKLRQRLDSLESREEE